MVKITKEMLNELLLYISKDNFKYGLIFKITYIYGRNIGEVLRLKKCDVDLKHNTLDFELPAEDVSFMLHENVKEDLLKYIDSKSLVDGDYIFIDDVERINYYIQRLNSYLKSFINYLNHNVLSWHCPYLVNRDFKNLRGQHLFMDGADIHTINGLYHNKNIQSVKDNIDYNELVVEKFPCNTLRKVFHEFTNLNVYVDTNFMNTELFTVCNGNDSLVIEYDYDTGVISLLGDKKSDLYNVVESWDYDNVFDGVCDLDSGHYKYFGEYKIIKN